MDSMVLATQQWLNKTYGHNPNYTTITEDGETGQATFRALIKALQIEIGGITVDGDFGNATLNAMPATISKVSNPDTADSTNLHYIIQGSLWCKGYNPGGFTGIFGNGTETAIKTFQSHAGIAQDGIIRPYILQGIMNTDGYTYSGAENTDAYYKHLVQLCLNQYYGSKIGLTPPNGLWERKSHKNLIKACQTEWGGLTVDGVFGEGTMNKAPVLSKTKSGYTNSKRLLQCALTVNGYWPGGLTGTFGDGTYQAVYDFQAFACLGADGVAGKNTWASLLKSCGNTARSATVCDTATQLTLAQAQALKAAGYDTVGRYLTNAGEGEGYLDKKLTNEEISNLAAAGLKVFPIYQTQGNNANYFTERQGSRDAVIAKTAARELGFPNTTTIYFAVDYDVLTKDIESHIIPYFQGLNGDMGYAYKIGVYGPRSICTKLAHTGLIKNSFVADMSSGFTGNIGEPLPENWAFDQFAETIVSDIGIDKCGKSSRDTSVFASSLVPYIPPAPPLLPTQNFQVFKDLYDLVRDYFIEEMSDLPTIFMSNTRVLNFMRQNYTGTSWTATAGFLDTAYISYVNTHRPDIDYKNILITDPDTVTPIEPTHFGATLNGLVFFTPILEKDVNAAAGWLGDVVQMGGILTKSLKSTTINYLTDVSALINIIGAKPGELHNYQIYNKDGNKIDDAGFSWTDLCADIDAYNIYCKYDFSETPIYTMLEEYYSKDWKTRFLDFKTNMLAAYNTNSMKNIVLVYMTKNVAVTQLLCEKFGDVDFEQYGDNLAQAFSDKIELLIQ